MSESDKFIEKNKDALLEEMAESINKMGDIITAVLAAPIQAELDGALMRTYFMAMSTQVGGMGALFNQYFVLLKGVVQKDERATGFASLIEHVDGKVGGIVEGIPIEPSEPEE